MLTPENHKNHYRFLLLTAFIFISSVQLFAQTMGRGTIKAILVDEAQATIPFASVILRNAADSTIYKTTIASENGSFNFSFLKEGQFTLEVKMMGFDTFIKRGITISNQQVNLDLGKLSLKSSAQMLKSVSIQGQKAFIERRADKIIVNMDNGVHSGSLLEAMDKLPGVRVDQEDQINLNGRSVQIYIDGKATPLSSDALASLLKGMTPQSIQKIELIENPSSKYDAAGTGGIINIVRKRSYVGGLNGSVSGMLAQGKYGKQNAGLNLNYKGEGFNVLLNTNYSNNKSFFDTGINTDFFNPDGQLTGNATSQINSKRNTRIYTPNLGIDVYLTKKTTLSASITQSKQVFDKDAESFNLGISNATGPVFLNGVKSKTNNLSSGLRLVHQLDTLGQELTFDVDYYNYDANTDNDNLNISYGNDPGQKRSFLDQERKFNVYSMKGDYTLPLKGAGSFETGFKSSYVSSNNSNLFFNQLGNHRVIDAAQNDFFKYEEQINALYFNYSNTHKKISYQLGFRGEYTTGKGKQIETGETFDKQYFQLFPSAYLDYKFDQKNNLHLSANTRINRPTYENLNPLIRILDSRNYSQGNPDLKPAVTYQASLTYSYNNYLFATAGYGITLDDFTTFSSLYDQTGITTNKPGNNKYTKAFNSHVVFAKKITPWWYINTGIDLNQQSYKANINGFEVKNSGRPYLTFSNYDEFSVTKKFTVLFSTRIVGENEQRNIKNDKYIVFNGGFRQRLFGTKGNLLLTGSDLFNTFKSRYTQNSVSIRQRVTNNLEARIFRLTFSYNFGGTIKKTKSSNSADDEKSRTNTSENQ